MQSNLSPTCDLCGSYTRVTNTFYEQGVYNIVRERKCKNCGHKMYTRQGQEEVLRTEKVVWPQRLTAKSSKFVQVVTG